MKEKAWLTKREREPDTLGKKQTLAASEAKLLSREGEGVLVLGRWTGSSSSSTFYN